MRSKRRGFTVSMENQLILTEKDPKTYYGSKKTYYKAKDQKTPMVPRFYLEQLGLKIKQKDMEFVNQFVANGGNRKEAAIRAGYKSDMAVGAANRILRKPLVQEYLAKIREKAERKVGWEYEDKVKILKKIATLAVPESATTMEEIKPMPAIQAIAESNKMQGHYSAEKIVQTNVNIDTDIAEVEALLKEYERPY